MRTRTVIVVGALLLAGLVVLPMLSRLGGLGEGWFTAIGVAIVWILIVAAAGALGYRVYRMKAATRLRHSMTRPTLLWTVSGKARAARAAKRSAARRRGNWSAWRRGA